MNVSAMPVHCANVYTVCYYGFGDDDDDDDEYGTESVLCECVRFKWDTRMEIPFDRFFSSVFFLYFSLSRSRSLSLSLALNSQFALAVG